MSLEVKVPDIGDFKHVDVIEVLVKPGDTVSVDQALIVLESDKASMEVPSSHAGVVKEVKVKVGDKVSEGSLVLLLDASDSAPVVTAAAAAPAPAVVPVAAPAPAPAAETTISVPDIGDFKHVDVIEVLVKPGDTVSVDQALIVLESDKASMEVPSSQAGVVERLLVKVGDKVSQGTPVLVLAGSAGAAPAVSVAAPSAAPVAAVVTAPVATPAAVAPAATASIDEAAFAKVHASPSVRAFARELGVDLGRVTGSGPKGRVLKEDVQGYIKQVLSGQLAAPNAPAATASAAAGSVNGGGTLDLIPWPKVDFAKFGPVESQPLSRIKKLSGANLARNWVMIPHVTNHDDADITELEALRVQLNKEQDKAKSGVKVTMLAFLIKACVAALKKYPEFNASLDGDTLVLKRYYHIGFAADTPNGLVVPVLRDADRKGILQIAQESSELAAKARAGKLGPSDMQGGCFSISSLGGIGGTYFSPIINAPEVAILGVCKSSTRPVWDGKQFVPRLVLPLSLSYDHRVIDGASAARFNSYLIELLADFRRVLL